MAICNRCGCKYRMNWVRMQPCPACRGGVIPGAIAPPVDPISGGSVANSKVTVDFELTGINPVRFIEWLQVECGVAEDGEGKLGVGVKMIAPVYITTYITTTDWEGRPK